MAGGGCTTCSALPIPENPLTVCRSLRKMKLKRAILSALNREGLKTIVDGLELQRPDRRSPAAMRAALSRSRRATPQTLLQYLRKDHLQAVCRAFDLPVAGSKNQLMQRVLAASQAPSAAAQGEQEPLMARRKRSARTKTPASPRPVPSWVSRPSSGRQPMPCAARWMPPNTNTSYWV